MNWTMGINRNIKISALGQPLSVCICDQIPKFNLNKDSQTNYSNISKNIRQSNILTRSSVRNYSYVNNINGEYRYCVNTPTSSLGTNIFNTNDNPSLTNTSQTQNQTLSSLQANILCGPPTRYINALGSVEGQPGGLQVSLKNSF
jgi:hypothetical protein